MNNELAQLESDLTQNRVVFSRVGLHIPNDLTLEACAELGCKLYRAGKYVQWCLADLAAFMAKRYGQLKEFAEINELNYQYVANLAWVANAVEPSLRKEGVDWAFYEAIAPFPPKEQVVWLETAVTEGISVAELRSRIRLSKGEKCALDRDGPATKSALKSCEDLCYWLRTRPPDFWTPERKAAWRKNLSPIVDLFNSIG